MIALPRWTAMLALAALAAGCSSNPADDVPTATVGAAQPVDSEATDGAPALDASGPADVPEVPEGTVVAFDGTSSKINFVGSKPIGAKHDGGFKDFQGQFVLDEGTDEVRSVEATIDMNGLWADNEKLTGHLKNEDFFEVATYPEAAFASTAIEPVSLASAGGDASEDATHSVTGNLTLHGQTKSITFPATIAVADDAVTLDADFAIDRTDWGVVYGSDSSMGDNMIRKEVVITLDLDADRAAAAE